MRPSRLKGGVRASQGLENVSQNKAFGSGFTDTNRARWAFTRVANKSTSGIFDPIAIDDVCIPVVSKAPTTYCGMTMFQRPLRKQINVTLYFLVLLDRAVKYIFPVRTSRPVNNIYLFFSGP